MSNSQLAKIRLMSLIRREEQLYHGQLSTAVLMLFLNNGAELERVDKVGRSALSWAAEGSSLAMVKLLIERGANVKLEERGGDWTAWLGILVWTRK
ncbi:hypothetical protein EMCG_01612 [[Emmonsia] crescens]|uniref:Uncharacterized protein n=1 Tax=[Emmonsia] crescens TaxID=73230 RepID=A0A0G2J2H6_9EURO|nr:hypothetical protein EMCG_01612 [Emmonsia crescens UAMH 3008]